MQKDTASIDPVTVIDDTSIKPFRVDFKQEAIDDLRQRIEMTRWTSKELVPDASQGVQEDMLQELARYWATEYDLGRVAERLNALPQFTTEIDGLRIHFIHVKSKHEDALPLMITHGWPGSVIEMLGVIGPLTDPTAHGGNAEDAFDLVIPSLPGFGFSDQPTVLGWDPGRTAKAWAVLMNRLGYTRYVAQGGDIGAGVTDAMGRQGPDGLLGIHLNLLAAYPLDVTAAIFGGLLPAGLFKRVGIAVLSHHAEKKEPVALDELAALFREGVLRRDARAPADDRLRPDGHARRAGGVDARPRQGQLREDRARVPRRPACGRPDTGPHRRRHHALLADEHRDLVGAALLGELPSHLRRDRLREKPPELSLPVGFTVFPGEIVQTPREWAKKAYPSLTYFNEVDKGGHFAAWEEPQLFSDELRAAFRSLR